MFEQLFSAEAFGYLLVLVRLTALVMIMPVLGDHSVPQRVRVALAMMITLVIYPTVRELVPPIPQNIWVLTSMIVRELVVGIMIGLVTRIFLTSTHTAGSVIAFQTGLAAAQSFDPSQGQQSVIVSTFTTLMAITLIVVTDLHHLLILGMVNSYTRFPVDSPIAYTDFAMVMVHYVSGAFLLGVQLALPFVVYGIVFNVSLGLISRMVQGFQVFFIGMPINLFMGFVLLSLLMTSMLALFLDRFRELILDFVG